MSQLTIEMDTPESEAQLLALVSRLGGRVLEKRRIAANPANQAFIDTLERIVQAGGAGESFGDPSEWQREIRSWDRVLDGREE
jgi:hypothetical protein